jgi:methionyl-tRNA formyltransferase
MNNERRLSVVLFALTGFGNTVLEALLGDVRVRVRAVFSVKYENPFPYYPERQLLDCCRERQVVCYHGVKVSADHGVGLLHELSPDLIIVASFKQMLKDRVLSLAPLGAINFHPSLLPRYRGPCPTNATLLNDDQITGVTVHYVSDKLDGGDILLQRSMHIEGIENDGALRRQLAKLAGAMVPELIEMFANFNKPAGRPQDHTLASFAPKPTAGDGYLERAADIDTIRRKMRAFNPLPGTSILVGDRRVPVDRFEVLRDDRARGLYERENAIDLVADSHAIRLVKKVR